MRMITENSEKIDMRNYITKLIPQAKTLQDKNDLGNLITFYTKAYPGAEKEFIQVRRKLGRDIVQSDRAWVNGYLLMRIGYTSSSLSYRKISKRLVQNYRGDPERWQIISQRTH